MKDAYFPQEIEKKWQKIWEDEKAYKVDIDTEKEKFYALVEFPYPSGAGLHVGHPRSYTALDVIARKKRMEGLNVLYPMGFDAFGLPAENYAVKTGIHPAISTKANIANFTRQLKSIGFSFDWDRCFNTCDPEYYKWTQWMFLKFYEKGLAYKSKIAINWCPSCKVGLANEEVVNGCCERCGAEVVRKDKEQWMIAITKYADRLIDDLKDVDFIDRVKSQQINWIGKSTGAFVDFKVDGVDEQLEIYTTRPDTLFGVTFMVMAPEHPLIDKYADRISNMDAIKAYRTECAKKTEFERTQLVKDKTGVKIEGLEAVNPVNGKKIPIFIADYVMMGYGTGAIMAVPAHDQRDYDFAKAFNIDIIEVIKGGDISKEAYTGDGEMVNSEFLNGYTNKKDSIQKMLEELPRQGIGRAGVQFKMKDWAFNRQRYWGEPIPIVHCDHCGVVPVPYEELPLRLPKVENFEPGVEGESPLAKIDSFVKCKCPKCGRDARRETDTMPQWAGSSWYFLRYIDPHNDKCLADPEKLKYWMPVDWYNGGMEHVTRHVIYSRFWHHFLYDIGVVNTPEPYAKRSIQGLILGPDGDKMSKSKGNVVDPLDIVEEYGADTLRTYVLFMGDYGAATPWNENSVKGCKRFLERVAGFTDMLSEDKETEKLETPLHKTIKKVSSDIEDMKFNTAIAALMTLTNDIYNVGKISKEQLHTFIKLLCPFAPHLCEEMWEVTGGEGFLSLASWPTYEEAKTVDAQTEIGVQINGKLRGTVVIPTGADKEEVFAMAKADSRIASLVEGKTFVKEIYVPNRVVNFVVK